MRVGRLDRIALEKPFVDGVQKVLLLGKIFQVAGRLFDGPIEPVERLQKILAAEAPADERVDHLFNFRGDDVLCVKSSLSKIVRISRSVSRCCTSILLTAAMLMFGFMPFGKA